jgi:Na+-transporting NADH:ubiquinone oxidoreductase subunit NqrC
MSRYVVTGGKIAGVCLACFLFVILTRLATASAIERRDARETFLLITGIAHSRSFGLFQTVEGNDSIPGYYPVWGVPGQPETYIVKARGTGYGGPFSLFVHCKGDGEILAVRLVENREYPGMGKVAETPDYMKKFTGTGTAQSVPLSLNELSRKDAEAVSGVSVTFGGIARAVEQASSFVKNGGIRK